MTKLMMTVAAAALAASTSLAAAQEFNNQAPAVSPSDTMQNPGGADGGLAPSDTPADSSGRIIAPDRSGTTGAGTREYWPLEEQATPLPPRAPQGGSGAQPVNPGRVN